MVKVFFAICLFALLCAPSWASDMRVYTELSGNAAFDKGSEITGGDINIVRELMRRVGNDASIEVVPWKRGYQEALNEPNVALFPTTLTKVRAPLFHWVGPLMRIRWLFVAKKGSDIEINSLDDARKVGSIGAYEKDAREQFLLSQGFTNLQSANTNIINYHKLAEGRLDLVVTGSIGFELATQMAGLSSDDFKVVHVLREVDLYLAISKSTKQDVVDTWKDAFQSMVDDGTFQRMYREWLPLEEPPLEPLPPQ